MSVYEDLARKFYRFAGSQAFSATSRSHDKPQITANCDKGLSSS